MASANAYTAILPYLRRYARLLTGSQKAGDVMVVSTLKTLVSDPKLNALHADARHVLYRVFLRLWRSPLGTHLSQLAGPDGHQNGPEHHIAGMPELSRPAFLLVTIEGFTPSEASEILEVTDQEFAALMATAHTSVSEQLATDVLIIEDELLIAFELEDLMVKLGHHVTSVVRTKRQAIKEAARRRPKLILADIQLADGSSGIDAVNEILETTNVPVVFITAYPERLLTGLRPEPTFLVTKPFRPEQISAVVSQALFFNAKAKSKAHEAYIVEALVAGHGYIYAT